MRIFWIRRGDVLGILLAVAFVAFAVIVAVVPRHSVGNSGFGPEWNCSHPAPGYSDPVCIKKGQ